MPVWATAGLVYFAYICVVALCRPAPAQRRLRACALAACGLLLCALAAYVRPFWLRGVVLPPLTLLVAYWSSGCLWIAPMPHAEHVLMRFDLALRVPRIGASLPRIVIEIIELAYAGIYPLVPIAFVLHVAFAPHPDAERFWTVVLVTDFICFGMLPWIQTRPPRAIEETAPWTSAVRAFNERLLRQTSIGVNTVPSGHAAEAFAAALLLSGAPWPIQASMWLAALAVSAGAVFGRYHFALDAIAGWAVALVAWSLL